MQRIIALLAVALGCIILFFFVGGRPGGTLQPQIVVYQQGDLPAAYRATPTSMPWTMYPGLPRTERVWYYELSRGGLRNEVGHITVVGYDSASTRNSAYAAIRSEAEFAGNPQPLPFGERGSQMVPRIRIKHGSGRSW